MTRNIVVSSVNRIMEEEFELEPDRLEPAALLKEDLELDSLDGVDLIVALEKEFKCRIEEEDARQMKTLEQIYAHLCLALEVE